MKYKSIAILVLMFFCVTANAQQTYKLDVKKSKILWDGRKSPGRHYGYVLLSSGNLTFSPAGIPTKGTFILDMNTLVGTDSKEQKKDQKEIDRVDRELKNEKFFDVAKYPQATMNAFKIVQIGKTNNYNVTGELTIKGITNTISFVAAIVKNGSVVIAKSNLIMDRTKWNIYHEPKPKALDFFTVIADKVIADEIPVTLDLVFN